MEIVYTGELPEGVVIKAGNILLVGIGDETYERLCPQEGKQMELHC